MSGVTSWQCRGANAHDVLEDPQPTLRKLAYNTSTAHRTFVISSIDAVLMAASIRSFKASRSRL